MTKTLKVIVTSKKNLQAKYEKEFKAVEKLLSDLVKSDSKHHLDTKIVYIDDSASAKKAGFTAVASVTRNSAKKAVDAIYKKLQPAYLVLFGAQDVFPFQELVNTADKDDELVPSDLPYASDAGYNAKISAFTGPTRVVGRIADIPGVVDMKYLETVFHTIMHYKPVKCEALMNYFAVSTDAWKSSTKQSLTNIFGNSSNLQISPEAHTGYSAHLLQPLTHFYNCHGSPNDSQFYGQKGNNYPTAQHSPDIKGKISEGTVVAAECCYGACVYNPNDEENEGKDMSLANRYFYEKAIAFVGSSTEAYGPSTGNALADLMTQYFIKNVLAGASTGRALLEARQKFLSLSPHLDPYELKTLGQFYLLGDPSIQMVEEEVKKGGEETVQNRRLNLLNKGLNLAKTVAPSEIMKTVPPSKKRHTTEVKKVLEQNGFTGKEKQKLFKVNTKNKVMTAFSKNISGDGGMITFRTFEQGPKKVNKNLDVFEVLVVKESGNKLLGWRLYHRK